MQCLQRAEDYLHGSVLHWRVLSVTGARAGLCDLQVGEADTYVYVWEGGKGEVGACATAAVCWGGGGGGEGFVRLR